MKSIKNAVRANLWLVGHINKTPVPINEGSFYRALWLNYGKTVGTELEAAPARTQL